ncbi:MAG: DUF4364 family protein [Clostridia bacterium]|nr:DUF4364 family protein [Clostridia bacterium]
MDFKLDAFPVDENVSGLRSTEKIRIIICYILKNVESPLSRDNLQSALYDNGIANYFEISQAIDNLLDVGAVEIINNTLTLNSKGEQIARDLNDELSIFIKNKAIRAAKLTAVYERRKRENDISIVKLDDKKYRLDITLLSGLGDSEKTDELMKVSVFVTDSLQAETMKTTFLNNPVRLYEKVIEALTEDSEFIE